MRYKTKGEREYMDAIAKLPCSVCGSWPVELHHTDTGMGRRKDHMKCIPLCFKHHRGPDGIDGKRVGKRVWESFYGTEEFHLERTRNAISL